MITAYTLTQSTIQAIQITADNLSVLNNALWLDLLNPSQEEETWIEQYLKFGIPSKKEMEEIEISSRLYRENHTLYMTATMLAKSESSQPKNDAVTFILAENVVVTVRYVDPQAFTLFISKLSKLDPQEFYPVKILLGLLESSIDRLADVLEKVTGQLDYFSSMIFRPQITKSKSLPRIDYQKLLQEIGINDDLGTKIRESLISFNLLTSYWQGVSHPPFPDDIPSRFKSLLQDIYSLSDHATFVSNKTNFLLNAILGMINIEQSNIIKIFSVAAVIFLPPTLIASIYGMNFHSMPELNWSFGYPMAISLMILSAWLPYKYFKKRKWL